MLSLAEEFDRLALKLLAATAERLWFEVELQVRALYGYSVEEARTEEQLAATAHSHNECRCHEHPFLAWMWRLWNHAEPFKVRRTYYREFDPEQEGRTRHTVSYTDLNGRRKTECLHLTRPAYWIDKSEPVTSCAEYLDVPADDEQSRLLRERTIRALNKVAAHIRNGLKPDVELVYDALVELPDRSPRTSQLLQDALREWDGCKAERHFHTLDVFGGWIADGEIVEPSTGIIDPLDEVEAWEATEYWKLNGSWIRSVANSERSVENAAALLAEMYDPESHDLLDLIRCEEILGESHTDPYVDYAELTAYFDFESPDDFLAYLDEGSSERDTGNEYLDRLESALERDNALQDRFDSLCGEVVVHTGDEAQARLDEIRSSHLTHSAPTLFQGRMLSRWTRTDNRRRKRVWGDTKRKQQFFSWLEAKRRTQLAEMLAQNEVDYRDDAVAAWVRRHIVASGGSNLKGYTAAMLQLHAERGWALPEDVARFNRKRVLA